MYGRAARVSINWCLLILEDLAITLPSQLASVPAARAALREYLSEVTVDDHAVALGVSEAVSNAVIHAYARSSPLAPPGTVRLHAAIDDMTHRLVVDVEDDGGGMSPRPDSPGAGLGLPLIAQVADSVQVEALEPGTRMRMRFALGP